MSLPVAVGGRLHQRYVYGKTLDCEKWMADWKNCLQYEKTKEPAYLVCVDLRLLACLIAIE